MRLIGKIAGALGTDATIAVGTLLWAWAASVVVLPVMKLMGALPWPWLWVLAPLWFPLAICVLLLMYLAFYAAAKSTEMGE